MSRQRKNGPKSNRGLDYTFKSVPRQQDNQIVPAVIHGFTTVSSSAGGVINASISMDPSSVSNTDWADFSSTYDEFRVLGARLKVMAMNPNSNSLADGLCVVAFDNDSSAALSSFGQGQQYNTAVIFPLIYQSVNGRMLTATWYRPTAGKETTIPWIDVASSSNSPGAILFYATGLTASTLYSSYTVELLLEFRGRR